MGALMREVDWAATPVGPPSRWPRSLRGALGLILGSASQLCILWGTEFTQFYNDAFRPILGAVKHPSAMGQPARACWSEVWDVIAPMYADVAAGGSTSIREGLLVLQRNGFLEECYFDYTYSPLRDEQAEIVGILAICAEVTDRAVSARRMAALGALHARGAAAQARIPAAQAIAAALGDARSDVPFALVYLTSATGESELAASAGVELHAAGRWTLDAGEHEVDLSAIDRPFPGGAWPEPAKKAMILPLRGGSDERPLGHLVVGASPRLPFDDAYREFLRLLAHTSAGILERARSLELEKERAAALAELDRAKTTFFANVSHEFRTPLTLMLAPIQDMAALPAGTPIDHAAVDLPQRNATRLLKLVNTLLEFSRIEAGRADARYEPVDVAKLTTELVEMFRSPVERAGLALRVDCPPVSEAVYLDRAMWEKIVLNLLSNAFKFTFEGSIAVRLRLADEHVILEVEDTGTGIADDDLPRVFERFHRVEGARSRSHEGSGIGLALIEELIRLHGGEVSVRSRVGLGTTFEVRIPRGSSHLDASRVGAARARSATTVGVDAYLLEASGWGRPVSTPTPRAGAARPRILYADDNADLRDYVSRLLSERWDVETVGDGAAALASIRREPPALLLSDVMMPTLDGFALTEAIRADPGLRALPIVLLSARSGEEESSRGFSAGANDYIAKPFSARDLLVRVASAVAVAQVSQELRALEEAQRLYLSRLFEHAPVGIAVLRGPDHVFDVANPPYLRLVAGHTILHRPIRAALPELEGQGIYELLDRVYQTGEPFIGRSVRMMVANDQGVVEDRFFDFSYQPVPDPKGSIESILVVVSEITELATARRDADAANRAKDEFFAILGHELRNPLAPIATALQLLRLRGDAAMPKELTIIERQVAQLTRLVDDLLDVSRITTGKAQLKRVPVELAYVVGKAIEAAAPLFESRRHRLDVEVAASGLVVDGDVARLTQVVTNLLTNAAKYTEPGGHVKVSAAALGDRVALRIVDDGIGIPADVLPRVFEPFVQSAQALDRAQGGLGLGLTIVSNLVTLHGGSVEARSDGLGKGSAFTILLPLSEATPPASVVDTFDRPSFAPGEALRILVVDDNVDGAEMLAEALGAVGCQTRAAFDAVEGLRVSSEWEPHVALLDLGLPVMDGFELARRLRLAQGERRLCLVAVTGYGDASNRDRVARAGFDAHLVKPISLDGVIELIEHVRTHGDLTTFVHAR